MMEELLGTEIGSLMLIPTEAKRHVCLALGRKKALGAKRRSVRGHGTSIANQVGMRGNAPQRAGHKTNASPHHRT